MLFVAGVTFQTTQKHREPPFAAKEYAEVDADTTDTIGDATDLHAAPCATHDLIPPGMTTEQYLRSHARHPHLSTHPHHQSLTPFNHAYGINMQSEADPLMVSRRA